MNNENPFINSVIYDNNNNLIRYIIFKEDFTPEYFVSYKYDKKNRVTEIVIVDNNNYHPGSINKSTLIAKYTAGDLIFEKISQNNNEIDCYSKYYYNDNSKLVSIGQYNRYNELKFKRSFLYDDIGRLSQEIGETFNSIGTYKYRMTFSYNSNNKLIEKNTFDTNNKLLKNVNYVYDENDNIAEWIEKDFIISFEYSSNILKKSTYINKINNSKIITIFNKYGYVLKNWHLDSHNKVDEYRDYAYNSKNLISNETTIRYIDKYYMQKKSYGYDIDGKILYIMSGDNTKLFENYITNIRFKTSSNVENEGRKVNNEKFNYKLSKETFDNYILREDKNDNVIQNEIELYNYIYSKKLLDFNKKELEAFTKIVYKHGNIASKEYWERKKSGYIQKTSANYSDDNSQNYVYIYYFYYEYKGIKFIKSYYENVNEEEIKGNIYYLSFDYKKTNAVKFLHEEVTFHPNGVFQKIISIGKRYGEYILPLKFNFDEIMVDENGIILHEITYKYLGNNIGIPIISSMNKEEYKIHHFTQDSENTILEKDTLIDNSGMVKKEITVYKKWKTIKIFDDKNNMISYKRINNETNEVLEDRVLYYNNKNKIIRWNEIVNKKVLPKIVEFYYDNNDNLIEVIVREVKTGTIYKKRQFEVLHRCENTNNYPEYITYGQICIGSKVTIKSNEYSGIYAYFDECGNENYYFHDFEDVIDDHTSTNRLKYYKNGNLGVLLEFS